MIDVCLMGQRSLRARWPGEPVRIAIHGAFGAASCVAARMAAPRDAQR
jgi:hypothetical protein